MGSSVQLRRIAPLALAALASALMFSSTASAVALGNIASQSAWGQPLKVVIPVILVGDETINTACLRLVSDGTHEGAPQLLAGRINFDRAAGDPRLLVTTARPVTEPALRLSVQAGCDSTIRRDYVLLFDPPETQRPAMLASADSDEFAQYARSIRPAAAARARRAQSPVAASPMPVPAKAAIAAPVPAPTSLGRTNPDIERTHTVLPVAPAPAANAPATAAPATAPATAPRDLVTLVADRGNGGGLIAQASAQSLPRITTFSPRSEAEAPSAEWESSWLYGAAGFGVITLGLTLFSLRRHMASAPLWTSSATRGEPLNANTAAAPAVTFAHFGAMTEPAPITSHAKLDFPPAMVVPTTEDGNLDTLLNEINADVIDEQAVRDAWKTAASENAVELGSDSILQAIESAERDMQIGAPSAMDRSLDNDLLREVPRRPAGGRR